MNYFVTAIGTDSGKTVVSAIFVEALKADYWKPVQAGFPRDLDTVKSLVSNTESHFFPETYLLQTPASPHASAKLDGIEIDLEAMEPPETEKDLIVEGAGGLLVPLNQNDLVIDLAEKHQMPVVLVSNLYLGSINHTLLSAESLRARNLEVTGIIFNGPENPESEAIILKHSGYKLLLNIKQETEINQDTIRKYALELLQNL